MGMTYEQLTGDLSSVNYSSMRAGLVEFHRRIGMIQHHLMVYQLCRPVWNRWFESAQLTNHLPFEATPEVKWIPQGFEWVDPLKNLKSQILAIQSGLKSRAEVVSKLGYDVEEIDQEIAADREREQKLGLNFSALNQVGIPSFQGASAENTQEESE